MAESKIGDMNYYQVSGWMLNRLGLKGTALHIYAIIYGFSQDGESNFSGSLQYLSDFTGASRSTVIRSLEKLVEDGFVQKTVTIVNGMRFNTYKTASVVDIGGVKMTPGGCQNDTGGGIKMTPGGSVKMTPNNKDLDNKSDNKEDKKEDPPPQKHKYGEYKNVLLTDEDLKKLKAEFPRDWEQRIERLSEYMASTGKTYRSHLATIRTWARREKQKKAPANQDYGRPEDFYN